MREILVGIDVGSSGHQVAIMVPGGKFVYEGYVSHCHRAFGEVIERLKALAKSYQVPVIVGLEGYNGHIAPFDQHLVQAGFEVLNVNPSRLYHFRRIYGAPYKNDVHDARLIAGYLKARQMLDLGEAASKPLLPIKAGSDLHRQLRIWSRHLNELIREQTRYRNRLAKRLKEYIPELFDLARQANRRWLVILLANCARLSELRRLTFEEIKGLGWLSGYRIGPKKALEIKAVLEGIKFTSCFEEEYAFMLKGYAWELLRLEVQIKEALRSIKRLGEQSIYYRVLIDLDGVGPKLAGRMVGEILSINNFRTKHAFAAYNGTCCLDRKSGRRQDKTTRNTLCNRHLQAALRDWAGCRIRCHRESRDFYARKRAEGKNHNHALKCLSRYLSNLVYRILQQAETLTSDENYSPRAA